tara:strand:+ start:141 stop:641 length:501 start_codon:yes stop_codon:yes gene_type:complete
MAPSFKPFESLLDKITKITGKPASNIKKWCYIKMKQITPNPIKPRKKKTIKEENLDIPSLQELLIKIVDKLNGLVDRINKIPIIERQLYDLEKKHIEEIIELRSELNKHRTDRIRRGSSDYSIHNTFGGNTTTTSKTGGKLKKGGTTIIEEKLKQKLINDIMKLQK